MSSVSGPPTDAFYRPLTDPLADPPAGNVFESSPLTGAPWGPDSQHAGPPSALLARAIENHEPRPGQRLARLAVDILAPVPVAPLTVEVQTVKPGRRTELIQATAAAGGRTVLIARAWRLTTAPEDITVAGDGTPAPTPRATPTPQPHTESWPGMYAEGYVSAIDWSPESGGLGTPGPARVWTRPRVPLVAGEKPTPWQRTLIVADSSSGVSLSHDPRTELVINCDIEVVLHRDPADDWILLDAATTITPGGGALAHARLGDLHGPIGVVTQTLFAGRHR